MGSELKVIGVNIHLSIGEEEWLKHMQDMFGCTEQEALKEIIEYKREQAFGFEQQGNLPLARKLLQEIDEWDDTREQEYQAKMREIESKTIITVEKPHVPTRIVSAASVLKAKGLVK